MQTTFLCFSHNLNYALGWTVVHSLWQATVIALLSGVLMIALREKTAKMRYLLSNLALLTVLAASITTFCIYYDFTKEAGQVVFIPEVDNAVNAQLAAFGTPNNAQSAYQNSAEGPLSIDGLKAYFNRHIYLIVTIWILGVALFMLRLLGSISYVYYLKSRLNFPVDVYWQELLDGLKNRVGVKRGIELLESALVRSPIVIGHLKPVILFPIGAINRLNPNEVEAILAHELAHILRNDYVFNIIQSVIEALFYFHPAVWWISAQIRNERENCCDDMAIQLCGNAMNYAKSLVSVQEMAYYSPQMAMAFAGKSNKNQLLLRVQRVLNQPQTKTNVREKLTATCVLVALMVSLAFSSNRLNQKENDLSNSITTTETTSETTSFSSENDAHTEGSLFLKYFDINNELDSLPMKYEVKDGAYNFSDATQNVDLTVKNNSITQFNINGLEVASADIPKFEKLIKRIVMPQPPTPPVPPSSTVPPMPPTPPSINGFSMQSNGNQLNVDDNGLHLNGVDDNGKPIHLSVDENGLVMQSDGINMNLRSDENTYEEDAKPLEGLKNYNREGQLMTIITKNGTIQNYNTKGDLTSIFRPNGVVKNYKNKQLTTVLKNGKKSNYNHSYNTNDNKKDPYNAVRFLADNGFSYVVFDLNGDKIWKCYKEGNLLGDITLKNKKPYFNGHEATSEELKRLGLLWYNNSFNPLTGGFQITSNKINDNTNGDDNDDGNIENRVEQLQDRIENLKEMLSECDCQKIDNQWFMWAKARLSAQNGLIKANKTDRGLDAVERELNSIKRDFDKIKSGKKKSDCQDCDEKNGFSYSYGTSEQDRKNAEKMAQQAQKDARQAQRDAATAQRDAVTAQRDAETARRDAQSQARGFNYSYSSDGDSPEKSEVGRNLRADNLINEGKTTFFINGQQMKINDKVMPSIVHKKYLKMLNDRNVGKNGGTVIFDFNTTSSTSNLTTNDSYSSAGSGNSNTTNKAKIDLFINLVKDGYLSVNKKCRVTFDNDGLTVDGKDVDDAVFKRYKADFEQKLGKKAEYSIEFKGIVTAVKGDKIDMAGNFHIDIGD